MIVSNHRYGEERVQFIFNNFVVVIYERFLAYIGLTSCIGALTSLCVATSSYIRKKCIEGVILMLLLGVLVFMSW